VPPSHWSIIFWMPAAPLGTPIFSSISPIWSVAPCELRIAVHRVLDAGHTAHSLYFSTPLAAA
jgi:hypothetical protein